MRATSRPRARAARCRASALGVIRESMLVPPGSKTEEPIVTAAAREIKDVLGAHLGATLVESSDPLWTRDPDIETMTIDFRRALARLVPVFMPDILFRLGPDGQPVFQEFAAAIVPTEFMPGKNVRQRHDAADRLLRRAGRRPHRAAREPRPRHHPAAGARQYVPLPHLAVPDAPQRRLARASGFTETLADWAALNARSKFWGDDQRAAFRNWEEVTDPRNPLGGRQGVDERIMLRELLRRVDMMVMLENRLDALVRLHTPWPPGADRRRQPVRHREQPRARSR